MKLFLTISILFCSLHLFSQNQGDTILVKNKKLIIKSTNLISNPGFESGFSGWTDATTSTTTLSSIYFTNPTTGGVNNSRYLVGTTNASSSAAGSIGTGWPVSIGKMYYFKYHVRHLNTATAATREPWLKVSLTNDKTSSTEPFKLIDSTYVGAGGAWTKNDVTFYNTSYSFIVSRFRWLNNLFGFDEFGLYEVEEAPLYENLEEASEENPVDMTAYILNPTFINNTTEGWNNPGTVNYNEVEFYQKTFDMNQVINGLPAGKYRLKIQGFERPKLNDSGAAFNNSTETIYARFYAGSTNYSENSVPFPSLYKHSFSGTGSLNGYVNTMASAQTMMNASNYETVINNIIVDAGGQLTIGAKTEFQQSGYWALFDNFRLEYVGKVDSIAMRTALANRISEAELLKTSHIQQTEIDKLNQTIVSVNQTLLYDSASLDSLRSAKSILDAVILSANESLTAYKKLQKAIDEARVTLSFLDKATDIEKLNSAIASASLNYQDLSLTLTQIINATNTLKAVTKSVGKQIYVPTWMMGDVYNSTNNWSIERSKQSKNWILFWEPGFGTDPGAIVDQCLTLAEKSFELYADTLKFIHKGSSKTDNYKMIIRLRYGTEWEASGSGVDNTIGLLTLTSWALTSRGGQTIAHEVGHCFQYQVHCDNNDNNGWMYGYGTSGAGGNGFWEQCAQWQAYQVFPEQQFTSEWFSGYLNAVHKHPLHEAPRYNNYFIQDFWTFKRGRDIIGNLWNLSKYPEDPLETYKRINGLTQNQLNDEMWECGARFASWDIPLISSNGASKIASRPQPKMNNAGDNYWKIDSTVCLENYGHNIIKLNVPAGGKKVTASFEGLAGSAGFRKLYPTAAGWRFGFVAMKFDGTRVYGDIQSASMSVDGGKALVTFECPALTSRLWLVVSGAPSVHWRHAWDDNDSNDEQWPYQVKFNNTNYYGYTNVINGLEKPELAGLVYKVNQNQMSVENLPAQSKISIFDLNGHQIITNSGNTSEFSMQLQSGIYIIHIESKEGTATKEILIP